MKWREKLRGTAYPVQIEAGSNESNRSAWKKYAKESSYLCSAFTGAVTEIENAFAGLTQRIDGVLSGGETSGHTEGELTLQQNGKREAAYNGAADVTVDITAEKIGTYSGKERLLFPNGDTMGVSQGNL